MAVGVSKAVHRRPGHEEVGENAIADDVDAPRLHSFVIIVVRSRERHLVERPQRWVRVYGEAAGHYLLANLVSERCTLQLVLLTMPFDAMAEHLVEEHCTRPSRQDGRSSIRLLHRRCL